MRQERRDLRTFLAVVCWLELLLVAVLGFLWVAVVYLLTRPFDSRRLLCGRAFRQVGHAAALFNPLWRFRIHGSVPKRLARKTVCIANHCSHTDVFLICHLPFEMKWLAKQSLFKLPFVGWAMWLVGDLGVERGSASAKDVLVDCAEWIERGVPIFIFPEGTRSPDGEMKPFKDGAFELAIETGAEVLPMAVAGTETALPKHDWRPAPARGLLRVGTPITTAGMTRADVESLKQQAFDAVRDLRDEILPLTRD